MKKKKILYIITKSNWGGAQKSVYDLATHMPSAWFDVSVALGGNGTLATKLAAANIRTINLPFLERDISFIRDGLAFFSLLRLLWRERPGIVHLHSSKIGAMGAVAGRIYNLLKVKSQKSKVKIIFTAHGWAFREKRPLPIKIFITFFQWLTVTMSHATIAVSNTTKHEAPSFFPQGKIVVIPNGIAEPHFLSRDEARAHLVKKTGAPLNTFLVGTIGELTGNKGYIYAIRAIAHLALRAGQQLTYIIIGDGEDKEKLLKSIREGRAEHVIFITADDNAARLLPAFDCFLLPSIKEGLPYVLLEAGLAKIPVIATDIGGILDIIQDKKNGVLVPPRDSDAIAKAIDTMVTNKTTREQYAQELFATAQRNFSLTKMIQETTALYTPTIS